jgi:hypothetical protein
MAITSTAFASGYKEILDDFFAHFEKGEVVKAFDGLYATNDWIDEQSDDIKGLKSEIKSMQNMVGDYIGKKEIGEKVYEDFLAHFTYAVLYERQPVIMDFTFYKSGDKWVLYNYTFGSDLDKKLKEKVHSKMLK